jgi:high-affinity iron transporter
MLVPLLITFRETLEAAIVVGIVLTFLAKTDQRFFNTYVRRGIGVGILIAAFFAVVLEMFFGGFQGATEALFEGILMFVTAGFITWMILWVHRQQDVAKKIKEEVVYHVGKGYGIGILILVATAVFREGTETVLYLKASSLVGGSDQLFGAALGILAALALGYALFRFALRVNLGMVFTATNVFLVMFAAGLVSHGIHEFQELGMLPVFSFDPVFDITHILGNDSLLGSLLRTLFGYTATPTVLELVAYASCVAFILWLKRVTDRMFVRQTF